mmetsp:Transcript_29927/g.93018  ORF Transcript_29927/g.93018 Transcript_29927/m.93018 type:complete len:340 (-) Transcript_29927:208-1227(-)
MPNIEVLDAREVVGLVRNTQREVLWISPLDVYFSQNVVYPRFADGRSVDDTVNQIRANGYRSCPSTDGAAEEQRLILEPPFPIIEAVRWAPKMRDGKGRPLLDDNGNQRHGDAGIFSVDNRRLYALQRAAVAQYPSQCCTAVSVITDKNEVLRHLKKFRTRTNGLSITISEWNGVGRDNARMFSAMRVWDWRSAIARAAEAGEEGSMLAVEAASSGSCGCWEYLDHKDVRRGPFSNWQMRQWWERRMLPTDLRIRPYDAAAIAERETPEEDFGPPFRSVEAVFQDAPSPFAAGFSPRATDQEADCKRCAQCGRRRWEGWTARGEWYCVMCWKRWKGEGG